MQIYLAPETLFSVFGIAITNAVFTGLIVFSIISIFTFVYANSSKALSPSKFQLSIEFVVIYLYQLVQEIVGVHKAKKIFGFVFTFFVFILVSNWVGLISLVTPISFNPELHSIAESTEKHAEDYPKEKEDQHLNIAECLLSQHCYITFAGEIKQFHEAIHLFRSPSTDLSATLTLSLISVIVTNAIAIYELRLGYFKKFLYFLFPSSWNALVTSIFSFSKEYRKRGFRAFSGILSAGMDLLINSFVGILEIVSEFGKIISFSFRLLGNIFAGEVLLLVLTSITFGLATLPFLGLEIFVGLIQAVVFFMLTTVFIGLATSHHDEH